jgi:hypothetical protein
MQKEFKLKNWQIIAIILVVAICRIPVAYSSGFASNFTPIGAMALVGGAYFGRNWKAFLLPLVTLLISDIAINIFVYEGKFGIMHSGWYTVYASFALIVLIGAIVLKKITPLRILGSTVAATLLYWAIMDFSVFASGCPDISTNQTMDFSFASLLKCYAQGFPFIKNFFSGTLVYSIIMFAAFYFINLANNKALVK